MYACGKTKASNLGLMILTLLIVTLWVILRLSRPIATSYYRGD